MKLGADMTIQVKNQEMKHGGFSPHQWVLGANPRVPGSLLDEEEMGQLGAISAQLDASTEFGLRARCRFTARKSFVKSDCSTRVQSALLRKAKSVPQECNTGDTVM